MRRAGLHPFALRATWPGPAALAVLMFAGDLGCSSGTGSPGDVASGSATGSASGGGSTGAAAGSDDAGSSGAPADDSSAGQTSGGFGGSGSGSGSAGVEMSGSSGGASSAGSASGDGLGGGGASGGGPAGSTSGGAPDASSGGPPDAQVGSGGDAGGGGSKSLCGATNYKLCEDFENGTAGSLPPMWTTYKGYGAASPMNVTLDTAQFHSGKMSLKSNDLALTGAARAQRSLAALGATASKHWGRIFYRVESPAPKPASGVWHNTWTSLHGAAGEDRVVDTVENTNAMHQWLYNIPSDGCCTASSYNWGYDDAWHCAEWYVDVSANSFRFFSDSKEVPALAFTGKTNSSMSNPYTDVIVGSTSYQQHTTPWIMWFDDLAINDTQVGCQ